MAGQVRGPAVAAIAAGGLLTYAGLKGKSVLGSVKSLIQGQSPATAPSANPIANTAGNGTTSSGEPITAGDFAAGASEQSFFTAVLKNLSAPVTDANLQAFYAWYTKEEPTWPPPTAWTWNPLNIKNGVGGFASYPTPQAGAFGLAGFMLAGNYGAIIASLRTGNGIVDSPDVASELSAWSGGGYTSVNSGGG